MKFGVSLYSYQVAYADGKMDLEACLKAIKALPGGADGVEILADRRDHFPQSGYVGVLNKVDQGKWKELNAQYGTKPVCYDSTINSGANFLTRMTNPPKDVYDTQMAWMKDDLDFCADMGFPIMRGPNLFGIYEEVIRDSLKYAEERGIKICMEIHNPLKVSGDFVAAYAEMVEKSGTKAGGFIPDFAIFTRELAQPLVRKVLREGADPEQVKQICETFKTHGDLEKLEADLGAKSGFDAVKPLLDNAKRLVTSKPEDMRAIGGLIHHVHAKFYEVDEHYIEQGIDFEGPLKVLKEIGYQGYIHSEYEGQRMMDKAELDEVEQVRRNHVSMHNILDSLA